MGKPSGALSALIPYGKILSSAFAITKRSLLIRAEGSVRNMRRIVRSRKPDISTISEIEYELRSSVIQLPPGESEHRCALAVNSGAATGFPCL